jgi:hypothetical protein
MNRTISHHQYRNQDQEIPQIIRLIGRNMGFETALRGCVTFVFRFLMGTMAGLPPTVMSLNALVSFISTALVELPAGIFADLFGRVFSTRIGCWFQSLAAISLFAAICVHESFPVLMWTLIILEGVLDSLGNACLSGAREALYQGGIINLKLDPKDEKDLRKRILGVAERYGVIAIGFAPPILVALTVLVQSFTQWGHLTLLGISMGWILLGSEFKNLALKLKVQDSSQSSILAHRLRSILDLLQKTLTSMSSSPRGLWYHTLIYVVSWFAAVTASAYLPVSIARSLGQDHPVYQESIVGITIVFCLGRVLRAYLLPMLLNRSSSIVSLKSTSVLICLVGITCLFLLAENTPSSSLISISLVLMVAIDILTGIVLKTTSGEMLSQAPHDLHATLMSLVSSMGFMTQGVFSLFLTFFSRGCPTPKEVAEVMAVCGGLSLVLVTLIPWKKDLSHV